MGADPTEIHNHGGNNQVTLETKNLPPHPKTETMIGVRILEPAQDDVGHVDLAVVALRITGVSAEEPRRILRRTELCVVADDECIFGSRGLKDRIISKEGLCLVLALNTNTLLLQMITMKTQ